MSKNIILALITIGITFIPSKSIFGQPTVEFLKQFKSLQQELPRERIFLHTDRDWYYNGDRIWFSAYVLAGSYNFGSELSKVLYVELISPRGELVNRVAIELEEGRGSGSIKFTERNSESGKFRIKAYTAWALNFGDSYIFRKDVNVLDKDGIQLDASDADFLDVQFLPEAGRLVEGLATKLAFKAIGDDGFGKEITGVIINDKDDSEIKFSSEHLGMGSVNFTPKEGLNYKAVVNEKEYELPEVMSTGFVMSVNNTDQQFIIKITTKGDDIGKAPLLFAHVRGELFAASVIPTNQGVGAYVINKEQIPTGIVHFTLLNENGVPVSERLAFNKNDVDKVNVQLTLNDELIEQRSKTGLYVGVSDFEGFGVISSASISVFDDSIEPYDTYLSDINSRIYLETELSGYIEQPGFYFSDNKKADEYLDILMLTQGWRSYDMSKVKNWDQIELFSMPEKGFRVSGSISGGLLSRSQKEAPVFFTVGSENSKPTVVTTDENGEFVITDIDVTGNKRITIKGNNNKGGDNISIKVDQQFAYLPKTDDKVPQVNSILSYVISEEDELDTLIDENDSVILSERAEGAISDVEQFAETQMQLELDEITVTSERVSDSEVGVLDDFATQIGRNLSSTGTYIELDKEENLKILSMDQILNRLPGVSVVGNDVQIRTGATSINTNVEEIFLLNGIFVDFATIKSLVVEDIESIAVLRSAVDLAIFGADGAGGAIVVTLKKGTSFGATKGLINANIEGYQLETSFYSPKYGVTVPQDLEKKDNRITLHWEPEIEISESGYSTSYWGNDIPSTYRVVIQGITETGLPFSTTKVFRISE